MYCKKKFKETTLPTILSNYERSDIYNTDELGLFYRRCHKKIDLKKEKFSGGKHSKIRLTGMAAVSNTGVKLPMFVKGKSKKLRCFKGIPIQFRQKINGQTVKFEVK